MDRPDQNAAEFSPENQFPAGQKSNWGPRDGNRSGDANVVHPTQQPPVTSLRKADRPQLPANWKPSQLAGFLGELDREMRALINGQGGITDLQEIKEEVGRVVLLKRIASERLIQHVDATEAQRGVGQRGFLQALSHLASMGDLKAAEELQTFAEGLRNDPNPELRSDSQLVLIGFAIESLRHGKEKAAARVLQLVNELLSDEKPVDVATLMVLGQAKDTLLQYEQNTEAAEVRDLILQRFGSVGDADVARMAAMIAASGFSQSNSALERLDQMRQRLTAGPGVAADTAEASDAAPDFVSVSAWREAIELVLAEPADFLTAEFLAGVSLEAEAFGRDDIASATYEILQDEFAKREDSLGQVARTALRARANREKVLGQTFDPDLLSVSGQPLEMADYRGKVVLMPFWSSAFPDSLVVLPNLLDIQDRYPDQVEIIGMNVDVTGASVVGFVQREGLPFPSFRSESDPSADIVNEVAYRFGAVTLLFVAVINQGGQVVHLDFSGGDLTSEVEKLFR